MNNCILIISHSNYLIKSGGIEKFIRDNCKILRSNNIHYIHAFPVIEINKRSKRFRREFVGLSLDEKFLGIWNLDRFADKVEKILNDFSFHLVNCQIHHFHGWNTKKLSFELERLNVPVYFMVHDLESIAPCMNKIGSNIKCKLEVPVAGSSAICNNCKNCIECVNEQQQVKYVLNKLHLLIKGVYTPSENTKKYFMQVYSDFKDLTMVRGHLKFEMSNFEHKINSKIRVAYLGSIAEHKGYIEWKELTSALPQDKYSLYYFGTADIDDNHIKSIRVDSRENNLNNMTEQLRNNNIDIAFLWSICPETYCYTYYEAIEAGCFVFTNCHSGNIHDEVMKYSNGISFSSISKCVDYLKNYKLTKETLDKFTEQGEKPINVRTNDSLIGNMNDYKNDMVPRDALIPINNKCNIHKSYIISLIYKILRMRTYEN